MTIITLPATPTQFLEQAVEPALLLLPAAMSSHRAMVMLIAIAMQESGLKHRWQVVDEARPEIKGAARGLLQFELGTKASRGGCWGVYLHSASRYWLSELCTARAVDFAPRAIWERLEHDDVLAAGVARLLLFTDAQRLPAMDDEDAAWDLYAKRTWCPGKPHRHTWGAFHRTAREAVERRMTSQPA